MKVVKMKNVDRSKDKPSYKTVVWDCEKDEFGGCGARNTRRIKEDSYIVDDVCDYCKRRVHEPLTRNSNTK